MSGYGRNWSQPTPKDWSAWETLIFEKHLDPSTAAKQLGHGGSSAFARDDKARHKLILDRWRADRDEGDLHTARDTVLEVIQRSIAPDTYEALPALRAAELLAKFAGALGARVELTGADGGPIEVHDRSASLADLARVLEAAGALAEIHRGAAGVEVPEPPALLAAPVDS